jgi:hypothetical protein
MDKREFIQRFIIQQADEASTCTIEQTNILICRALDMWDLVETHFPTGVGDSTNLWDYNDK